MSLKDLDDHTQLFIDELNAQGYQVSPYYWQQTHILLGYSFEHEGAQLVFRVEADDKQIVFVKLKRSKASTGLNNPLAVLFVTAETALKVFSPQWRLRGDVDVFRDSRLSSERLGRFYEKWCGASLEPETGWYCLLLANYRPLKAYRK